MPVYKISNFELTDGKQCITFNELYIAIEDNRTRNFDLLLTYPMFKNINIVIRPTSKNRKITFVIDRKKRFSSRYTLDKDGKICYTESCLQQLELTEQDVMANEVYKLIQNSNI